MGQIMLNTFRGPLVPGRHAPPAGVRGSTNTKKILKGVTGYCCPTQTLAIFGPSGAGKPAPPPSHPPHPSDSLWWTFGPKVLCTQLSLPISPQPHRCISHSFKASNFHPLVPCPAIPSPHRHPWRCAVPDDAPGSPRVPDQGRRLHRRPGPLAPGTTFPLVSLSGQPLPEISLINVNTNYCPQRFQFIHSGLPGRGGDDPSMLLAFVVKRSNKRPEERCPSKFAANRPMTSTPSFVPPFPTVIDP